MSKPIFDYDHIDPLMVRQMSLQLGYLILQSGGTVTIPPLGDVAEMLEAKWALEADRLPNGGCTLKLIPMSSVPGEKETPNARAN